MLWTTIFLLSVNAILGQCFCVNLNFNSKLSDWDLGEIDETLDVRASSGNSPQINSKTKNFYRPKPFKPEYAVRSRVYFPEEDRSKPSVHEYHPTRAPFPTTVHSSTKSVTAINSNEKFSGKLYQALATQYRDKNLIYSPLSLHSLLSVLWFGAEHETAKQLLTALELPKSESDLLRQFKSIMSETESSNSDFKLNFAQKIYFKNEFVLRFNVRNIAKTYFGSDISAISFDPPSSAAEEINTWVASKTEDRIRNVITPGSLDSDTQTVLVNALYLKAKWAREFSTMNTVNQDFFVEENTKPLSVDMMYIEDDFKYGDFPELNARVIELPFLDSELSMLIILPNQNVSLASMEGSLRNKNLNRLMERMRQVPVTLRLPKFSIESELNMEEPLKTLGIRDIFTNNSQLGKLFSNSDVKVSKILHKAFINVNEGGLEASAATFIELVPLSLQPNMVYFTVDHPFMFAIRSSRAVYFVGHVIDNFN